MRSASPATLFFCALVSLGSGIVTIWFVWDDIGVYESVCTAFLTAPLRLMIPLWVGFYLLLGASAAWMLDGRLPHTERRSAVGYWLLLLLLGFVQAGVFFRLEYLAVSFALAVLALAISLSATPLFARASRTAGLLLLSCVVWQAYLCYLTLTAALGA